MEEEWKKILFVVVFSTYLLVFLLKFWAKELIGCRIWFYIQWVPTLHTFDRLCYPKNKKYLKKHDDDIIIMFFSGISYFWGSRVRQKYVVWILVGCKIKFHIQRALSIEIWVKTQRDMLKIRTKKVVFFFSSSKVNKYYFII